MRTLCQHTSHGPRLVSRVCDTAAALQPLKGTSYQPHSPADFPAARFVQAAKTPVLLYPQLILITGGGIIRNDLWHTCTARVQR